MTYSVSGNPERINDKTNGNNKIIQKGNRI